MSEPEVWVDIDGGDDWIKSTPFNRPGRRGDHTVHEQWLFDYPNGYGASVIRGAYTYGGFEGLWELAVTTADGICYTTPLTDDVVGYLSEAEVAALLDLIAALSPKVIDTTATE